MWLYAVLLVVCVASVFVGSFLIARGGGIRFLGFFLAVLGIIFTILSYALLMTELA